MSRKPLELPPSELPPCRALELVRQLRQERLVLLNWSLHEVESLVDRASVLAFDAGDGLQHRGEAATWCALVLSGEAVMTLDDRTVGFLAAGDALGADRIAGSAGSHLRPVSVRGRTPGYLLCLTFDQLHDWQVSAPHLYGRVVRWLHESLADQKAASTRGLRVFRAVQWPVVHFAPRRVLDALLDLRDKDQQFAGVDYRALLALSCRLRVCQFAAGEAVAAKHGQVKATLLVLTGLLTAFPDGGGAAHRYGAGALVGPELCLGSCFSLGLDVFAARTSLVAVLTAQDLECMHREQPQFAAQVVHALFLAPPLSQGTSGRTFEPSAGTCAASDLPTVLPAPKQAAPAHAPADWLQLADTAEERARAVHGAFFSRKRIEPRPGPAKSARKAPRDRGHAAARIQAVVRGAQARARHGRSGARCPECGLLGCWSLRRQPAQPYGRPGPQGRATRFAGFLTHPLLPAEQGDKVPVHLELGDGGGRWTLAARRARAEPVTVQRQGQELSVRGAETQLDGQESVVEGQRVLYGKVLQHGQRGGAFVLVQQREAEPANAPSAVEATVFADERAQFQAVKLRLEQRVAVLEREQRQRDDQVRLLEAQLARIGSERDEARAGAHRVKLNQEFLQAVQTAEAGSSRLLKTRPVRASFEGSLQQQRDMLGTGARSDPVDQGPAAVFTFTPFAETQRRQLAPGWEPRGDRPLPAAA